MFLTPAYVRIRFKDIPNSQKLVGALHRSTCLDLPSKAPAMNGFANHDSGFSSLPQASKMSGERHWQQARHH